MTDFSRRSFLAALGMTAASVALPSFGKIQRIIEIPKGLVRWDGPISPEWIAAEGIRLLAANLPYDQFRPDHIVQGGNGPLNWPEHARQFGVDMSLSLEDSTMPKQEFSRRYIEPAMAVMAVDIREHKPRTCFSLDLPRLQGMPDSHQAARAINQEHGFDLRFTSVYSYDPLWNQMRRINRFDMLTA